MTTALIAYDCTLTRGQVVYLFGTYPCVVTREIIVPIDWAERKSCYVPLTNIIAFGDEREEREYCDYARYEDISLIRLPI